MWRQRRTGEVLPRDHRGKFGGVKNPENFWPPPEARRSKEGLPPRASREAAPCGHWISDFWPPSPREDKSLLFSARICGPCLSRQPREARLPSCRLPALGWGPEREQRTSSSLPLVLDLFMLLCPRGHTCKRVRFIPKHAQGAARASTCR